MTVSIAAPHPAALDAARETVATGGGAIDAALAAAVALTVVYPHQCALGGDLVALVRRPDGQVRAIVSVGAAPAAVDVEALAKSERMPPQGALAVTVPGVVAGWQAIHALGGVAPLDAAFERAARLAAEGIEVVPGLARAIASRAEHLRADAGFRDVFVRDDGTLLAEGDTLVQPALAATMRELAGDPSLMYRGRIADSISATLQAGGSAMTVEDFAAHRAEVVAPVEAEHGGARWWVAPPPTQGAVLLGVLPAALHADTVTLVETVRDAALVRQAELGDPRGGAIDLAALLDPGRARRGELPRGGHQLGDTVAVVAVGDDGTVVTLIQSVYQTFGCGILDPGTGVVLHNRGSAFSTDPRHPGRIGPGLRPPHTLLPVIAATDELVVGVGCQGGSAQPWILSQLVPALVEPAAEPAEVLRRPRFIVGARDLGYEEMTLVAEPGADPAADAAAAIGLPLARATRQIDEAGHAQVVRLHRDGRIDAASDPRADGAAEIFQR